MHVFPVKYLGSIDSLVECFPVRQCLQFPCKEGSRRDTQLEYSQWHQADRIEIHFRGQKITKRGGESGIEGVLGVHTQEVYGPHAGYRAAGGAVALVLAFNVMLRDIARRRPIFFLPLWWGVKLCCLLYTSPSPRDQRGSRMPSSA